MNLASRLVLGLILTFSLLTLSPLLTFASGDDISSTIIESKEMDKQEEQEDTAIAPTQKVQPEMKAKKTSSSSIPFRKHQFAGWFHNIAEYNEYFK